ARVVRPPGYHHRLSAFDRSRIERDPALVKLIVDGSFVAVIAAAEHDAVTLMERASRSVTWERREELQVPTDLSEFLVQNEAGAFPIVDGVPREAPVPELNVPDDSIKVRASY